MGRALLAVVIVLAALYGCETQEAQEAQRKPPEVDPERGMRVLWSGYKEPKEELSKRHPEPEAKKIIRLTGDLKPVELSSFHSCAKFFKETVRPPFEARVPYCDDRWESGWVEAGSRAEGEFKLDLVVDGQVQQTATLTNERPRDSMEYTDDLVLRTPKAKKDRPARGPRQ